MSGGTKQLCFDFRALGMIGALAALLMTLSLTADARGIDTWVCTNETDPEKTNLTCSNAAGHGGGNKMNLTCTTAKGPGHKLRCDDTTDPEPWLCMDLGPPGGPWNCTKQSDSDGSGGSGGSGPAADKDGSGGSGPAADKDGSGGSGPAADKDGSSGSGPAADKGDNDSNGSAGQTGANIASSTSFCSTALTIAAYFVYRFAFSIFDL